MGLAAAAAIVLVSVALRGSTAAYALTLSHNGTLTLTIRDLTRAAPALNARFAAMGIDQRVVPIRRGCREQRLVNYPQPAANADDYVHPDLDAAPALAARSRTVRARRRARCGPATERTGFAHAPADTSPRATLLRDDHLDDGLQVPERAPRRLGSPDRHGCGAALRARSRIPARGDNE